MPKGSPKGKGMGGAGFPKGGGGAADSGGSSDGPAPKGGSCQGDIAGGMSSLGGDAKVSRVDYGHQIEKS
jgi:hypothetical protein